MDETLSPLINATRKAAGWTNTTGPLNDADFAESSKKHQMNGFLYCNAPGMTAPFGKKCAGPCPLLLTLMLTYLDPNLPRTL